jgi:hypothetical protein
MFSRCYEKTLKTEVPRKTTKQLISYNPAQQFIVETHRHLMNFNGLN